MNPAPKIAFCGGEFIALAKEGHWECADRTNATGAAFILERNE